jgi:hypothetical protein
MLFGPPHGFVQVSCIQDRIPARLQRARISPRANVDRSASRMDLTRPALPRSPELRDTCWNPVGGCQPYSVVCAFRARLRRLADRKKQALEFPGFRADTLLHLLPAQYPGCADFNSVRVNKS